MNDVTINIEGKDYSLDDFKLGDLEWLEDELDVSFSAMGETENGRKDGPLTEEAKRVQRVLGSMRAAVRFVYCIKRMDDETFTLEDARNIKLSVAFPEEEEPEEAPPTKPAKPRSGSRSK